MRLAATTIGRSDRALGAFYRRLSSRTRQAKGSDRDGPHDCSPVLYSPRFGMTYQDPGAVAYEERHRTRDLANLQCRAKTFCFELAPLPAPEAVSQEGHPVLRAPKAVKFAFLNDYRGILSRAHACRVMGVTDPRPSGVQALPCIPSSATRHGAFGAYPQSIGPFSVCEHASQATGSACLHAREAAQIEPGQLWPAKDDGRAERVGLARPGIRCPATVCIANRERGGVGRLMRQNAICAVGTHKFSVEEGQQMIRGDHLSDEAPTATTHSTSHRVFCSRILPRARPTGNGLMTSPISGCEKAGSIWPSLWTCLPAGSSAGPSAAG